MFWGSFKKIFFRSFFDFWVSVRQVRADFHLVEIIWQITCKFFLKVQSKVQTHMQYKKNRMWLIFLIRPQRPSLKWYGVKRAEILRASATQGKCAFGAKMVVDMLIEFLSRFATISDSFQSFFCDKIHFSMVIWVRIPKKIRKSESSQK